VIFLCINLGASENISTEVLPSSKWPLKKEKVKTE